MNHDFTKKLVESIEEGSNEPGKRDGTGPYRHSAQRGTGDVGRRKAAGQRCPASADDAVEDSGLQIYGREPSGGMGEEGKKKSPTAKGVEDCEECDDKKKDEKEGYDEGVSEMVGIDAIAAWAKHRLPEGVRVMQRTILIGNKRVAERHEEALHARVLNQSALSEESQKRALSIIERGLRNAGYKVELVDCFTG